MPSSCRERVSARDRARRRDERGPMIANEILNGARGHAKKRRKVTRLIGMAARLHCAVDAKRDIREPVGHTARGISLPQRRLVDRDIVDAMTEHLGEQFGDFRKGQRAGTVRS